MQQFYFFFKKPDEEDMSWKQELERCCEEIAEEKLSIF